MPMLVNIVCTLKISLRNIKQTTKWYAKICNNDTLTYNNTRLSHRNSEHHVESGKQSMFRQVRDPATRVGTVHQRLWNTYHIYMSETLLEDRH